MTHGDLILAQLRLTPGKYRTGRELSTQLGSAVTPHQATRACVRLVNQSLVLRRPASRPECHRNTTEFAAKEPS